MLLLSISPAAVAATSTAAATAAAAPAPAPVSSIEMQAARPGQRSPLTSAKDKRKLSRVEAAVDL